MEHHVVVEIHQSCPGMLLHSVPHLLLVYPEGHGLRIVKSETDMEISPGAHNEEELWSARVKFTKRAVAVQELVGQVFYCPVRNR